MKGVGKSTLEMLDEFIKTGTCARLEELEEVKQVKLVKKTPKTTKKTEEEKLKCGVGIFREEGFNNGDDEKGYYMFPYRKSDKKCLHEDITLYYKDLVEDRMLSRNITLNTKTTENTRPIGGLVKGNTGLTY